MPRQKNHIPGLADKLAQYADGKLLDLHQYTPYHLRLTDGGFVALDVWTTGRYFILMTDYAAITGYKQVERQGEKGQLPLNGLDDFLTEIFYPYAGQDNSREEFKA